jgi:hypothetical protein
VGDINGSNSGSTTATSSDSSSNPRRLSNKGVHPDLVDDASNYYDGANDGYYDEDGDDGADITYWDVGLADVAISRAMLDYNESRGNSASAGAGASSAGHPSSSKDVYLVSEEIDPSSVGCTGTGSHDVRPSDASSHGRSVPSPHNELLSPAAAAIVGRDRGSAGMLVGLAFDADGPVVPAPPPLPQAKQREQMIQKAPSTGSSSAVVSVGGAWLDLEDVHGGNEEEEDQEEEEQQQVVEEGEQQQEEEEEEGRLIYVLGDWGLSTFMPTDSQLSLTVECGTVAYMAPEMLVSSGSGGRGAARIGGARSHALAYTSMHWHAFAYTRMH